MTGKPKAVDKITIADLEAFPVWKYVSSEQPDETHVKPVKRIPVIGLKGKIVGTQVMLANGDHVWALLGNVDPKDARITEHFLTISIETMGQWFTLARYHDFDIEERGPETLAQFLGLSVDETFPIAYDIRKFVKGDKAALQGLVLKSPRERLSRSDIIALAVP